MVSPPCYRFPFMEFQAGRDDTDAGLMRRIQTGDEDAFGALVTAYQRPLLNLAYRYLGDAHEAEDVAQEVFVRVLQAAPRWRPTAKVWTWVYRIAVNLC